MDMADKACWENTGFRESENEKNSQIIMMVLAYSSFCYLFYDWERRAKL
jgi:hypothetical protein